MCGRCGRKLKVHYQGRRGHKSPAYHCPASILVENRGEWCVRVGGGQIDQAVTGALLAALTPAGVKAALQAAEALPVNYLFAGKGNASRDEALIEQILGGAAALKLHEDWGTTPAASMFSRPPNLFATHCPCGRE